MINLVAADPDPMPRAPLIDLLVIDLLSNVSIPQPHQYCKDKEIGHAA